MHSENQIKWIVTIVDRGKGELVAKVLRKHKIVVQQICRGHGTAASEIMDCLGLDEPEKDIVLSLCPGFMTKHIMHQMESELSLNKPGGISFAIPLSGISLSGMKRVNIEELNVSFLNKEGVKSSMEKECDLIVAIVDNGASDDIVDAARDAGARGGTVINARTVYSEEVKKIFGIIVQPEKEIVMILVSHDEKQAILKAVCAAVANDSDSHGIAFSLPVSDVVGGNFSCE